ncbi:MAG: hypothetical protein ACI9U2_000109, partial [Bradymonadia bacterium]
MLIAAVSSEASAQPARLFEQAQFALFPLISPVA